MDGVAGRLGMAQRMVRKTVFDVVARMGCGVWDGVHYWRGVRGILEMS